MSQGLPKQMWVSYKPTSSSDYDEFRDILRENDVVGYLLQGYNVGKMFAGDAVFYVASSLDPKFAPVPTYTDGAFDDGFVDENVIVVETKEEYIEILKGRLNF